MNMKFEKSLKGVVFLFVVLTGMFVGRADAQKVAAKTNLLYAATTSPNLALEFRMGKKTTLELGGGISLWKSEENNRTFKHWMAQPELRYWFCDVFNGHFLGLHAHGGQFNVGGIDIPLGRLEKFKDTRYEGYFYGAGLSYGYQWVLGRHWNIEASIGGGYARFFYDKFPCAHCGKKLGEGVYNYWGITRSTLSLVYVF
ncbi:MAG: DUF3575 domain-containing protein [Porphyromonas sp.]|nr:DUF3575 domain-containing protein [Porphyromonas sp.]MDY3067397.1 DUF3575 domain-containing protein [Porphyromonas sp.]